MRASFDGARKHLAADFNALAKTKLSNEQIEIMQSLRQDVVALLCMYDDTCGDDCHDLINEVHLAEVVSESVS